LFGEVDEDMSFLGRESDGNRTVVNLLKSRHRLELVISLDGGP